MATSISANYICDQIIQEIRSSQLNFVISETPYSAQISLRKKFLKEFNPGKTVQGNLATQQNYLEEALDNIEKFKVQSESDRDTIAILETKVQKAEADLYDSIEKQRNGINNKMEEIKVMKGALKNKDDEISRTKSELAKLSKIVKANEKEIYKLENLSENKDQTIKNLKDVCRNNKREKDELVKANKMKTKKKRSSDKNSNLLVSQTEPSEDFLEADVVAQPHKPLKIESIRQAAATSGGCTPSSSTTAPCILLNIPPAPSEIPVLNTSTSNSLCTPPVLPLSCSPRTPPGVPPPCNPTSPTLTQCKGIDKLNIADGQETDLVKNIINRVLADPFTDLKEKIVREKLSFDEIVEEARNIKIKVEESDEIVENDEDYENYDYDWVDYSDGEETF